MLRHRSRPDFGPILLWCDAGNTHTCRIKFLNFKSKEKKLIQIYILLLFQPSDNVEVCQFELRNESRWKSMSQDAILSVCGPGASPCWPTLPPLCSSTLDSTLVSNDVEQQLRILLFEHRRVRSFITWTDFNLPDPNA